MSKSDEQPERPGGPESFGADEAPATQPDGALAPPPAKPPAAFGAAAESFPPDPRRIIEAWRRPGWERRTRFAAVATEIFNILDELADRIAERWKLRR